MLLNVINFAAPLFTYSETATAHVSHSGTGMFDEALSQIESSGLAYGEVLLNAKYAGWKVVGLRYIRWNHNSQYKSQGMKDVRVEVLGDDNVWRTHATVRFPYGENSSLVKLENNPLAPILLNSKRRIRLAGVNTWGGSKSTHWLEFQFVVGY